MKKYMLLLLTGCVWAGAASAVYIEIGPGEYRHTSLTLWGSDVLVVAGGGAIDVTARDTSSVEIVSTSSPLGMDVGGVYGIWLSNSSSLHVRGGLVGGVTLVTDALATFQGGQIVGITSYQNVFNVIVGWDAYGNPIFNTHIEMVVRDHTYNPSTKVLTGRWMDETPFSIQLVDRAGYDNVIDNIRFTPEPGTLLLLAAGGLVALRRRTRI